MVKLQNSNCDKTQTQIVRKCKKKKEKNHILGKPNNWHGDNSKTQNVTKLKSSRCDNCENSNFDLTQKLKIWNTLKLQLWQNPNFEKTQNLNCDKTHKLRLLQNSNGDKALKTLLIRTTWHLNNRWDILWAAFCNLAMVFIFLLWKEFFPIKF